VFLGLADAIEGESPERLTSWNLCADELRAKICVEEAKSRDGTSPHRYVEMRLCVSLLDLASDLERRARANFAQEAGNSSVGTIAGTEGMSSCAIEDVGEVHHKTIRRARHGGGRWCSVSCVNDLVEVVFCLVAMLWEARLPQHRKVVEYLFPFLDGVLFCGQVSECQEHHFDGCVLGWEHAAGFDCLAQAHVQDKNWRWLLHSRHYGNLCYSIGM
jgi:hypothetical protein